MGSWEFSLTSNGFSGSAPFSGAARFGWNNFCPDCIVYLHKCFPWLNQKRPLVTAPYEPCQISTVLSFASPLGLRQQILTDSWLGYLSDIYQNFRLFFPLPRGWEDKRVNKNLLPSTVIHQNLLAVVQKTRAGVKEQDICSVKNSKI